MGPGDRVAWFQSISFDSLANNLHSSIIAGATVVIQDDDVVSSIPRFLAWCESRQISHLRVPTSFGHVMLDEMVSTGATPPTTLKAISLGGEQVRADVIEAWRQRFGTRVQLWNNYGPTETTVWVTTGEMTAAPAPHEWVPVGRPMRSVRVRIRDTEGATVPVGVAGELYLGGPLVARGYLGSPELTESRFETDEHGVRWFRSGDLGRWLRDGQIEVLGRIDRQVKIRGFRVEPAEIEVVLRDRPEVDDAVVVARPGIDGELSLHAYVVSSVGTDQLGSRLAEILPPFLRPSTLTVVDQIPRGVSGKLDVSRLPDPATGPVLAVEASLPEQDTVGAIAGIWAEVLKLDAVGPDEGFFELGGHSLLAIRVMSRIRERLGVEVPLTAIFTDPTVAGLAAVVDELGGSVVESSPPSPEVSPAEPALLDSDVELNSLLDEIEALNDEEAVALLAQLEAEEPGP